MWLVVVDVAPDLLAESDSHFVSKLCWDEIVLSHDDQDGVEFFLDLKFIINMTTFFTKRVHFGPNFWLFYLDTNQLYF